MAYAKTEEGEEPKHTLGGIIGHAVKSMFGNKGDESEKEQSPEYHQRRTNEELEGSEAKEKGKDLSMNVHSAEGNTPESSVTHPVLKTIMAKLNMKDEDEPASKGGYVGMSTKV